MLLLFELSEEDEDDVDKLSDDNNGFTGPSVLCSNESWLLLSSNSLFNSTLLLLLFLINIGCCCWLPDCSEDREEEIWLVPVVSCLKRRFTRFWLVVEDKFVQLIVCVELDEVESE